ncbi:MAG: RagB/SusD family nutrient uptake outer membrane protein [Prolixibacteraceae bacterium]
MIKTEQRQIRLGLPGVSILHIAKGIKHGVCVIVLTLLASCSEYLDVVPDNTLKLENIYATKEDAYDALAKIYSYLPNDPATHSSMWELGDEFIGRIDPGYQNDVGALRAERIMRGLQTTGDPLLGNWSGTNGGHPYYQAIRSTNVFLQYIVDTRNLEESERAEWIAQATFLKAYYHFLLLQKYGPIIISDKVIQPNATADDLFLSRSKVEDCFDYIIRLMDEAIPKLKERVEETNLGQLDQIAATAIKARVLYFRASPFYSGNKEFFGDFYDPTDGKPFFPVDDSAERTKQKWQEALTAINTATEVAERNGKGLYRFEKEVYVKDRNFYSLNPDRMKTYYDLRMVVVDPWNKELLWANSNIDLYNQGELAHATNMRLPAGFEGDVNASGYSWQWLGATYQMAERYYTTNGLPIEEDLTFNYNTRLDAYLTPGVADPDYPAIAGLMQPNQPTINLYMNREMRFYANLGITGGYYRSHFEIIPVYMMQGTNGGYNPSVNSTDFYCTGIGIQKLVHPESRSSAWQRQVKFPYPIMRIADLYLMKAEVLNEVKDQPDQEVWDAINLVRERAGVPDVETVWANAALARTVNKHRSKAGMRDIILEERSIELAFEGIHFWDMLRHKRAHAEFSSPIQGWNYKGTAPSTFFVLGVVQARRFTIRDYLWPIDLNELNTNGKLTQNPGW